MDHNAPAIEILMMIGLLRVQLGVQLGVVEDAHGPVEERARGSKGPQSLIIVLTIIIRGDQKSINMRDKTQDIQDGISTSL